MSSQDWGPASSWPEAMGSVQQARYANLVPSAVAIPGGEGIAVIADDLISYATIERAPQRDGLRDTRVEMSDSTSRGNCPAFLTGAERKIDPNQEPEPAAALLLAPAGARTTQPLHCLRCIECFVR